jgi:hypothetical protein
MSEIIEVSRTASLVFCINRIFYGFWILLDLKGDVN